MSTDKAKQLCECAYCLSMVRYDGLSNHKNRHCVVKRLFNLTKKEIDDIIAGRHIEEINILQSRIGNLEKENKDIDDSLTQIKEENLRLKQANIELTNLVNKYYFEKNAEIRFEGGNNAESTQALVPLQNNFSLTKNNIQTMIFNAPIADSTKSEYKSAWKKYEEWCSEFDLSPLLSSSANNFISYCLRKNPTLTVKRDRNIIQALIRKIIPYFTLDKIKRKIGFKREKNFLTKVQQEQYFNYLKENDSETFLAQYLQTEMG